jgi:3-oxoacyl-[acyl-carrier protein] reductase
MSALSGRIAVVTGASKGIGASIAAELAAQGATVVVNYSSSKEGAEKVVAGIKSKGGQAVAIGGSVAKPEEIEALFAEVKKQFGRVDILVNNAGVYTMGPLESVTAEAIHGMFDVNVMGLLLASKAALPLFPVSGGNIINIGSVVSEITPPMSVIYTGTKGAVDAMTRVLAKELGSRKIRVNAVNPGLVITEGTNAAGIAGSEFETNTVAGTPLGRVGHPQDIAGVVAFLASDAAGWVTGSLLQVGGGYR